jgi:hypothetical protein
VFHPSSSYGHHIDVESILKIYGDGMASEITFISSSCNLVLFVKFSRKALLSKERERERERDVEVVKTTTVTFVKMVHL